MILLGGIPPLSTGVSPGLSIGLSTTIPVTLSKYSILVTSFSIFSIEPGEVKSCVGLVDDISVCVPSLFVSMIGFWIGPIVSLPKNVSGFIGPILAAIPAIEAACPSGVPIPPGAVNDATAALSEFVSNVTPCNASYVS